MGTASGAQDVGQLDVATGRGGFSLTFLIAPLPCRNKDFRTRAFPDGVATRRSNHLILLSYLHVVLIILFVKIRVFIIILYDKN